MKKSIFNYGIILILICTSLSLTAWLYVKYLNRTLYEENYSYLEEVAGQSANAVKNKLDGDMSMLRAMAVMLGNQGNLDVSYWIDAFKKEELFQEFERIGIILPNGKGYGRDVSGTDFSDREYFKQAMSGNYYISDVMTDRTSKVLSNTYAVPVYSNDKIIAVLAAVTLTETYQKILFANSFEGEGYSYIVKKTGEPVVLSNHPESDKMFHNIFDIIITKNGEKDAMIGNMISGESGRLQYEANGKDRFLNYVPLGINDWYVISVVPYTVMQDKSRSITELTVYACVMVIIIFLALILYILVNNNKIKKKLTKLAYYDKLTGIANKNLFKVQGKKLIGNQNILYAYVIIDIKKFKIVNDLFGYSQGDILLKRMADILKEEVKVSEMVSRFSSDIFHLLLEYEGKNLLESRLHHMTERICEYIFADDNSYRISLGLGIYVIDNRNQPIETMGDKAALALKKLKEIHSTSCSFYNDDIRNKIIEEREIENGMQEAIEQEEFKLYLQPKYSLETKDIVSAEALVRWKHPVKGLIPPDCFIPVFEKNGFICNLDLYMLDRTCKLIERWIQEGITPVPVSVNQSRMNLYNPDYIKNMSAVIEGYQVPKELIDIEITESAFFEDMEIIADIVDKLHSLGHRVSMDDFGAGYSSLNMLQDVLVDEIKIDKNFFNESSNSERGRKIVNSVISMANDINIKIVAEGVETIEQVHFLEEADCDFVQGYYFSRPIPDYEFEEMIR